jgi:hypothetical protein
MGTRERGFAAPHRRFNSFHPLTLNFFGVAAWVHKKNPRLDTVNFVRNNSARRSESCRRVAAMRGRPLFSGYSRRPRDECNWLPITNSTIAVMRRADPHIAGHLVRGSDTRAFANASALRRLS